MNKLLLIFIMFCKLGFGQDPGILSEYRDFESGEIVYMFGDDVRLRDAPSTRSQVLAHLSIGEKIEIIEKSYVKMEYDGTESPWYRIKTKDKVGFVTGSLISLDRVTNGNLTYLVTLKKDGNKTYLKTRVIEKGLQYVENISLLKTGEFSIKSLGNKGLDSLKDVFAIDYFSEACGVDGGGILLFYDGKSLIKAVDYKWVSDSDAYWIYEEYIFPEDEGGIKGKIVYKSKIGETKESKTEWVETMHTRRILEWNGREIIPKTGVEHE